MPYTTIENGSKGRKPVRRLAAVALPVGPDVGVEEGESASVLALQSPRGSDGLAPARSDFGSLLSAVSGSTCSTWLRDPERMTHPTSDPDP